MFNRLRSKPPASVEIRVTYDEPLYFLFSNAAGPSHALPPQTATRGSVILSVNQPATYDTLKLHYRICWRRQAPNGKGVEGVLKEQVMTLLDEERLLSRGEHSFPWVRLF
jgi:hypothetical protein